MLQAAVFGELLAVIGDFLGIAGAVGDASDLLEIMEHCLGLQVAENFTHGFASFLGICRGPAHGGAATGPLHLLRRYYTPFPLPAPTPAPLFP